ncbi:MAG: hypothetical protein ACREA3_09070 [Nitrosotalea sp.]
MTKWSKDAKEFTVKVSNDKRGSRFCRIPKPILDQLGSPTSIKFVILSKNKVSIEDGSK